MAELNNTIFINTAIGIVYDKNHNLLIARRNLNKFQGGRWEFPGGKIESAESPEQAVIRELNEEVGIIVKSTEQFMTCSHVHGENAVKLHVFKIIDYLGKPYGAEGQAIKWVSYGSLTKLLVPDANIPIISKLKE